MSCTIQYLDKMDLSKYYIKQWKYQPKETDKGLGVEGRKTYNKSIHHSEPKMYCLIKSEQNLGEFDLIAFFEVHKLI